MRHLLRKAIITAQNYSYRRWQQRNPGRQFKSYFAEIVKSDLRNGTAHPSLGENLTGEQFGVSGEGPFRRLQQSYGLKPDDVVVDYGCGTLRFGVHAVKYLRRGAYWGFDIDPVILDEGRRLCGATLIEEKAPNLRVISPESVAEASAASPALLVSLKVLIHVHPAELGEYFGNILKIIGSSGTAHITGKWSPERSFQFARQSWAHALAAIEESVAKSGGRLTILEESDWRFPDLREIAKTGKLEVQQAGAEPR